MALTVLRVPDYLSRFLVVPDRSFLHFLLIAGLPLAISLAAGVAFWKYADSLARLVEGANPVPGVEIGEAGYQRLLALGIALVGVFLIVEGVSELSFWIGRYIQIKKAMPHVEAELGEDFLSIFSTAVKILVAAGLLIYGRKAARRGRAE